MSENKTNKEFYVTFRIDGRFGTYVTAENLDAAKTAAIEKFYDADFGVLECVDTEIMKIEDEKGNYLYER